MLCADMLESMGDLEDLDNVFPTSGASFSRINRDANISNALKDTDCSGFIKVLPDNSDIVVGHSTWRDFYAMIRVYKVGNGGSTGTMRTAWK